VYHSESMAKGTDSGSERRRSTEFLWVFVLSFAFMYMILGLAVREPHPPLTILLSLPLSVPFAMLSLCTRATPSTSIPRSVSSCSSASSEERHPPDRPQEQPARARHGAARRHHAGKPRPAPPDPHDHARPRGRHAAPLGGQPGPAPRSGAPSPSSSSAVRRCRCCSRCLVTARSRTRAVRGRRHRAPVGAAVVAAVEARGAPARAPRVASAPAAGVVRPAAPPIAGGSAERDWTRAGSELLRRRYIVS